MDLTIGLWASLCSKEVFVSLESYCRGLRALREGEGLFSPEFFRRCPELSHFPLKYSEAECQRLRGELQRAKNGGFQLLYPGHLDYPWELLTLEEIPFLLRLQGAPVWKTLNGISIVGSREPSENSLSWMEEHVGSFLRKTPCCVISGGARGIDQRAHALALRTGRPTVVFLPSGLESVYPPSLQSWVPEIVESGGALLSEYENRKAMKKHYFAQRNRLISGLGRATLLIEARRHSGSLLTAREALEQGRPLWILPGHPMDGKALGGLDLLVEGATPVISAEQLSDLFSGEVQGISRNYPQTVKDLVLNSFRSH